MKFAACIFLTSGATFVFHNVRNEKDDGRSFQFDYTSVSDGKEKTASFDRVKLAGVSVWEE